MAARLRSPIASKNYGSWSLRGWLLCKLGRPRIRRGSRSPSDDPSTRAELLLLSPSFLVPCLNHDGVKIWDTLAIARISRRDSTRTPACCRRSARRGRIAARSAGEMHSGFSNLRSALPMNLEGALSAASRSGPAPQADIERVITIWRECLSRHKGPYLFGNKPCMAGRHVRAGRARASSPMTSSSTRHRRRLQQGRCWRCRAMKEWTDSRPRRAG